MTYDVNTMLPGGVVVLGVQVMQQLVAAGNGDAALLYMSLLEGGDVAPLQWETARRAKAEEVLISRGLICKAPADPLQIAPGDAVGRTPSLQVKVETINPPHKQKFIAPAPLQATQGDILHDIHNKPNFPEALNAIEEALGKRLSVVELQKAHQVYEAVNESLALLKILLSWCEGEQVRKYGEGHKPNMSGVLKEACIWNRMGIDTPDAARAHTQNQAELYGREKEILRLLDIKPRNLIQQERDYIAGWLKMGFDDPSIRLAYEKTVMKIQKLDWKYIDSILRSWHQEGRHTIEEVKAEPKRAPAGRPGGQQNRNPDTRAMEDMERMRRLMAQMKADDAAQEGGG